jgi:hypothetical protein
MWGLRSDSGTDGSSPSGASLAAIVAVTWPSAASTSGTPHEPSCSSPAMAIGVTSNSVRAPWSNRRAPGWYSSV